MSLRLRCLGYFMIVALLIIINVGTFGQQAQAQQNPEFVLRYAEINPLSVHCALSSQYFCQRVRELTQGRVEVKFYHSSALGASERQYGEQVMLGMLDFARLASASIEGLVPELGILNVPYNIDYFEKFYNIEKSELGRYLEKKMNEKNMSILSWFDCATRNIFSIRPIKSLDDLKGVKIRVMESEIIIDAWKILGAQPVPMPYGEVYSALQTKTIDAAENMVFAYSGMKFYEVAPYYNLTEHQGCPCLLIASKSTLDKFPRDLRELVMRAGYETTTWMRGYKVEGIQTKLDYLKKEGVTIVDFDKTGLDDKMKQIAEKARNKFGEELYQMWMEVPTF